jgi:polysaccharide biosynthesis transport protein
MSPEDTDSFIDLEQLVAAAWRQAKVVALCAVLGLAMGVVYLAFTPRVYTASTDILLDDSLTRFAEEKDNTSAHIQADAMVLSEVEILKSSRLARAVIIAAKLNENQAFLNPPRSPLDWLKDQVRAVTRLFVASEPTDSGGGPVEDPKIRRAVTLLQNALTAERTGRSFVIEVTISASDPGLAGMIARTYADAYLADHLNANFDATQRATEWLQGRLGELRDSSQAAALEVERFRAENGLTAARGELMSDQQLSELNTQLIVAQADTANALARYTQYKSIIDSGPENAVKNATIPSDKANSAVLNELKGRYLNITKRELDVTARFGADHPQAVALRREQADVTRQIFQELQQLTESYRNEYEVAKSRETSLRNNVGDMTGQNSQSNQLMVRLRELEQKSTALATLYQSFLARYEEASQQRSFPIAQARVISQAENPTAASSPRKAMVLAASLVLGLIGGACIGAYQEFLERFFRTGDDVRAALNINFLGYLPITGNRLLKAKGKRGDAAKGLPQRPAGDSVTPRILRIAINAPSSSFAETLRNVKLAADVVLQRSPCKVIGFVSVLPHEGKTTVAANFAGLLAANGVKTLLIDADLRNPGLSRSLSPTPEKGLVEAIVGDHRWQGACMVDRKTRLAIIPAVPRGHLSHTSELISGPGMRDLIAEARKSFDYIVVDLPPLGPVVDVKAFAPLADGLVLVAEWGVTPRMLVRSELNAEPAVAAKILGLVLNKTDMTKLARYGSFGSAEQYFDRYASYYVDKPEAKGKAERMEQA